MGSVALEGENKGNMLIMKVLEESKQFQVGSVVTRNPVYGWTKRKDGWPAVSDILWQNSLSVTALKYHPKYTNFMGQGIIWVSLKEELELFLPLKHPVFSAGPGN